jgi:hypothetical protein
MSSPEINQLLAENRRLRDRVILAEAEMAGQVAANRQRSRLGAEIERLRADRDRWHGAAMKAGVVVLKDGSLSFPPHAELSR